MKLNILLYNRSVIIICNGAILETTELNKFCVYAERLLLPSPIAGREEDKCWKSRKENLPKYRLKADVKTRWGLVFDITE